MVFEWTLTLGNVLTIISMAVVSMAAFFAVRADVNVMKKELTHLTKAIEQVSAILTTLAVQDERINRLRKDFDLLRTGEGFIFPLGQNNPFASRKPKQGA